MFKFVFNWLVFIAEVRKNDNKCLYFSLSHPLLISNIYYDFTGFIATNTLNSASQATSKLAILRSNKKAKQSIGKTRYSLYSSCCSTDL